MIPSIEMIRSIELEIARKQLRSFAEAELDSVMHDHRNAMECRDCEAHLQKGIDAYKWLVRAEEALTQADAEGIIQWSDEIENALRFLYNGWLKPCVNAEKWIESIHTKEYQIDNLQEFRNCCSLVRDWIERDEWYAAAKQVSDARFAEEPW